MIDMNKNSEVFDVVVIGGGPAGCQTGLYAKSEGLSTLVIEANRIGGQIAQTPLLENMGGQHATSGATFASILHEQAERMGVMFTIGFALTVKQFDPDISKAFGHSSGIISVSVDRQYTTHTIAAKSVVIATGTRWSPLGVVGETLGRIKYGPEDTMKDDLRNEVVSFIGAGNSAAQGILHAARYAKEVHVFARSTMKCSYYLTERMRSMNNIKIHEGCEVNRFIEDAGVVDRVRFTDESGISDELSTDRVYIAAGQIPNTEWVLKGSSIEIDSQGFLLTGAGQHPNETSMAGVFAVGDVRGGTFKALAAALGDARNVTSQIHSYLQTAGPNSNHK